jgi:hypothetical protein
MSVCVLVKVGEGLVLAADSATTIAGAAMGPGGQPGPQGVIKVFFNATKIFQIRDLPVAVMTWGAGAFQSRTIASLVEEFENLEATKAVTRENLEISDLSKQIWEFMCARSEAFFKDIPIEGRPKTGLLICGYSKQQFFPEEFSMMIPSNAPSRVRPDQNGQPNFGAAWYGMVDAIVRFHYGRDDKLFDVLKGSGIGDAQLGPLKDKISQELQYPVLFQAMPLGDAIDYARFLVDLTIARFRFVIGAELCGGPVDLASVSRKEGFKWIQSKRLR